MPIQNSVYGIYAKTNILPCSIYFALYIFWKVFKCTKWQSGADVDLHTGRAEIDRIGAGMAQERDAKSVLQKIWFWVA
jgi:amino acid transporter